MTIESAIMAGPNIEGAVVQTSEVSVLLENQEIGALACRVLEPDLELIQTTSLEAIEQANMEKVQSQADESVTLKFRDLTEAEKQELREKGLHDNLIDHIRLDENGNYSVKCINEKLAGQANELTNVIYTEKTITINNVEIKVVVPEFEAFFEVDVPEAIWLEGDRQIFKYCTEQLRAYLEENPELRNCFTPEQLDAIEKGSPNIPGMTWHHSEIPGKMQLVDFQTHFNTRHTGGDFFWCGGIR